MGHLACILDVLFLGKKCLRTLLWLRGILNQTETQNLALHHVTEEDNIDFKKTPLVERHFLLPLKLLFLEPIILVMTIYTAFIYGILYLVQLTL